MAKTESLKKNFVMNAILTISSIIFPLISFPYVASYIGPTGTGKVDFAVAVMEFFAIVAQLGIPTYGVRACAAVRDDKEKLEKTVHELIIINLFMSLVAYMVFIPILFFVPRISSEKPLFLIVSTTLWFNAIGIEYLYKGLEQYSYITKRSVIFKFIALIATFFLIKKESDYLMYGLITIFAASASNVLNFIHARKYISYRPKKNYNFKRHFRAVALFFAMACATKVYLNLDKLMLGFMTTEADVGYYGAAVKIKIMLTGLVTSLGVVLLPRASYYVSNNRMEEFRKITQKALYFVFVAAMPMMIFFIFFAKEGILFVSDTTYIPSIPTMQIIMPTILFIGITNILGIQVLVPLGKEKYVLYSEIGGAVIDLVLNIILIPIIKSEGAALGTTVAEFVVLIIQCYALRKIRKENPILDSFKHISYWKIIIAMTVAMPCAIWTKWISVDFDKYISRPKLALKCEMVVILAAGAVVFFGVYYVVMMILKDNMMKEITSTVFGKLKRKKA